MRKVMWAANVRTKSFEDRLLIAQKSEYKFMSLFPIDYKNLIDQGYSTLKIKKMLADANVKALVCDPYVQWVPNFEIPNYYPESYISFINFNEDFIFQMADVFDSEGINCVEGLNIKYEHRALTDAISTFANKAGQKGLKVVLEFMPISSIYNLEDAWKIIEPVSNVNLTFDTWHFFRSNSSFEQLSSIPSNRIGEIQLADAMIQVLGNDLSDDLLRFRKLPGEGELGIDKLVKILKEKNSYNSVGIELFSDEMDKKTPDELINLFQNFDVNNFSK
jgi:sugar phosphate isomerase/epimerase